MGKGVFWVNTNSGDPDQPVELQSTLIISKSNGLSEILPDTHIPTYKIYRIEEKK